MVHFYVAGCYIPDRRQVWLKVATTITRILKICQLFCRGKGFHYLSECPSLNCARLSTLFTQATDHELSISHLSISVQLHFMIQSKSRAIIRY